MKNETLSIMRVATATANTQELAADLDFEFVRTNAGKIYFDYPAIARTVNVGRRVP